MLAALRKRQPRPDHEPLFVNRYGQPLGAAGVRFKLAQYVQAAGKELPSLRKKRVPRTRSATLRASNWSLPGWTSR